MSNLNDKMNELLDAAKQEGFDEGYWRGVEDGKLEVRKERAEWFVSLVNVVKDGAMFVDFSDVEVETEDEPEYVSPPPPSKTMEPSKRKAGRKSRPVTSAPEAATVPDMLPSSKRTVDAETARKIDENIATMSGTPLFDDMGKPLR